MEKREEQNRLRTHNRGQHHNRRNSRVPSSFHVQEEQNSSKSIQHSNRPRTGFVYSYTLSPICHRLRMTNCIELPPWQRTSTSKVFFRYFISIYCCTIFHNLPHALQRSASLPRSCAALPSLLTKRSTHRLLLPFTQLTALTHDFPPSQMSIHEAQGRDHWGTDQLSYQNQRQKTVLLRRLVT